MKVEATQKGNPYKLTTAQHVFPRASIDRFSNIEGVVEVFSYNAGKVLKVKSNNSLFCAKRVWDQRTEVGIGKRIEDRFQNLVRRILNGKVTVIGYFEKMVVEEFFSLWRSRQKFKLDGLPDLQFNGLSSDPLTKDQQEILESNHTIFCRDGVLPGRFTAGIHVFGYLDAFRHDNRYTEWGIVRAVDGEFIVPDCFEDMMIIPISPKLSIMADQPNSTLTRCDVAVNNQIAISRSAQYYFARDFSKCPVYREKPPRLLRMFTQ